MANSFWELDNPAAIAHRGGLESAPENTIAAFRAAVDLGFRFLETDVHLTADGTLVAFHDEVLDRVTDRTGRISEMAYSEVAKARIGEHEIPTLDDLLDEFPDSKFNIDVKSDDAVLPFVEAVRRHEALERICVGAFSDRRLRRLRSLLGPRLCTAASPREVTAMIGAAGVRRPPEFSKLGTFQRPGRPLGFQCVQVPVKHGVVKIVTRRFVSFAHSRGLKIHVWTIDDADEMARLFDLGVDGLFTDRPSVLKQVLVQRGEWS